MVTLIVYSGSQAAFKEPVRPYLRDEARRCDQMSGARPGAYPRFTFHGSWKRVENDADGCGSFAAVERLMPDRLLR